MLKTTQDFIEDATKVHGNRYDYSLVDYKGSKSNVEIICDKHGGFIQRPDAHLNNAGCPQCKFDNLRYTNNIFIEKSNDVHHNKYDYSLVDYKNNKIKVKIICHIHGIFEQQPGNHLNGQGCVKCVNDNNTKTTIDFIKRSKHIHGDKYDYSLVNYQGNHLKVNIICPIHGEFEQRASNHLSGQNCIKCENKNTKTTEEFIESSRKIHGDRYDYSLTDCQSSKLKVSIICPVHGIFKQLQIHHIYGCGCPTCKESRGEKTIRIILKNKEIQFEHQKKFDNCKYKNHLPFDFYLPKYNTCIEFDGKQHFESVQRWGGDDAFKIRLLKDEIKNDYCLKNNIPLYRIRYDENIQEKMDNIFIKEKIKM